MKQEEIDPDDILTEEDLKDIENSYKEEEAGETISHEELGRQLGLRRKN